MSASLSAPRPRLTRRAALLGAVVLLLATSGIVPAKQYFAQRAKMSALEEKVVVLLAEQERLRNRVRTLQDPRELERLARECLGMVDPGEISFVAVPKGSGSLPASC